MSLRHEGPFRTGEFPVDNLGLEIDSCIRVGHYEPGRNAGGYIEVCKFEEKKYFRFELFGHTIAWNTATGRSCANV